MDLYDFGILILTLLAFLFIINLLVNEYLSKRKKNSTLLFVESLIQGGLISIVAVILN
ncbi:hypothetical protein GLW08_05785 [Pontibacillus yanchengensis]|uniref:Uncharacterized protein n=2 Tax=Pontibacillus yanchengensis TaxID=462910 RepID=A0ACC7VDH7_9BACI|nr:hypothetical protein [Pontibacillus yanchengensis]MYL32267.1 hypothetical protein [Pontibacillus yanchengensis]MYL52847.1 hypothetical protein [Pontibacillus yanchengensis]